MKRVQVQDYENIGNLDFIEWKQLQNKKILITGSTGLIGSNLVNAIAYISQKMNLNIKLILPVRNVDMATKLFSWVGAEICFYELGTELRLSTLVDYIVHLASPTASKFFTEKPVDTLLSNIDGCRAILDWAVTHPVRKFVNLSSMEVYGFPAKGHKIKENELGSFETMNSRNSYPLAKIAGEALCYGYYSQHRVPTVVLRATQTFGPGIRYNDERVFAQFMRCIVEKKDIVLKSKGLTERSYLYTADCVSGILVSLLKATPGSSYTIANPETYCSINDMAQMVANEISNREIKVIYDFTEDASKLGYAETLYMDLDVTKIRGLGWRPTVGLRQMFERMIEGITDDE